jgi:hypothetical protein
MDEFRRMKTEGRGGKDKGQKDGQIRPSRERSEHKNVKRRIRRKGQVVKDERERS